jgi:hypothetical protein
MLVVIRDFDVDRLALLIRPLKADSPLIVDADAVLALTVSTQSLESIPRRFAEIEELRCGIKAVKRDVRPLPWHALKTSNMLAVGKLLGVAVPVLRRHHPVPFLSPR